MGSGYSQEEYQWFGLHWYNLALPDTCVLPDVGIDESLLKFSGSNSNTELQIYSSDLINSVPDFIEKLGSAMVPVTSVPNAVGIGALVISMIMELCIKSSQINVDSYRLLQRVFGEEKASSVRDTMSEYLKSHRLNINDNQRLLEEIQRLEQQLSNQLTTLRNSLLDDGQMSTRGFKIWVNGASFHVQMLIHQARLEIQAGKPASDHDNVIQAAIDGYLKDLDTSLEKFKTYMTSITELKLESECNPLVCPTLCYLRNTETKCYVHQEKGPCSTFDIVKHYINSLFSRYEPIISLKDHFSNIKNNVDTLIKQHDNFTLPSE